jgi:hypothetical protein
MEIKEGNYYRLSGITQKGKNRIRENGSEWTCVGANPEGYLFESSLTSYLKWNYNENPEFDVQEIIENPERDMISIDVQLNSEIY